MITRNELKKILNYNRKTGIFKWNIKASKNIKVNDIAGTLTKDGYIHIKINRKIYKAHRLVWLYIYGEMPNEKIDHKNHIKNDNRFRNLRLVTHSENMKNLSKRKDNKSGYTGVYYRNKNKKWCASIRVDKKQLHIGYFDNRADAIKARKKAEKENNFYINHGA